MKLQTLLTIFLWAALAGCAHRHPNSTVASPPTTLEKAGPEARLAPPVAIPAQSSRKVVLVMTGPKAVVDSKDWNDFKREWRDTFTEYAKEAGVAFELADDVPQFGGTDGTLLRVEIADFRMVGIGARVMFGIMTGNAYINAKVSYMSLRDGSPFGDQAFMTTSSAGAGVFAKVTPQQVAAIATSVFLDIKAAQPKGGA